MRLILIGPMAAGKSTVGKRLARRLNLNFIDIDEEVEKAAGVSISWIFDVEGEEKFRERESKELIKSLKFEDCVVATGGGVVLSEENRNILKKGTVIYLEISIQTQLERTLNDNKRPLLQGEKNKEQTLRDLKEIREPLFKECANMTIKEAKNGHNETVDKIIDKGGIKIMGETNILNKLPTSASNLYAKNKFNFVINLYDKEKKEININLDDEIIEKNQGRYQIKLL